MLRTGRPPTAPCEQVEVAEIGAGPTQPRLRTSHGPDDFRLTFALGTPHQADSADPSCLDTYDNPVSNLELHNADIFGFGLFAGDDADLASDEFPSSPFGLDLSRVSPASLASCLSAQDGANLGPLDPALTAGPQETGPNAASLIHSAVISPSYPQDQFSPDTCQVPLEQLSRLNLELHRHLSNISIMKDATSILDSTLNVSDHQNLDSLLPIALMIQGLQKFQDLLHNCSTHGHKSLSRTMGRSAGTDWGSSSAIDENARASKRLRLNHSSSSHESRRINNSVSSDAPANRGQSAATTTPDVSYPSSEPRILWQSADRNQIACILDLPTQMLFVTCYLNLTRFCRRVFFNIRQCLASLDPDSILARLSSLLISGVSLESDGHLQIFVLIQVVSRMLDAISTALGYSMEHNMVTDSSPQEDMGGTLLDKTTSKLMEFVMNEEELSEAQGSFGGGIKALREEIQKVKTML